MSTTAADTSQHRNVILSMVMREETNRDEQTFSDGTLIVGRVRISIISSLRVTRAPAVE